MNSSTNRSLADKLKSLGAFKPARDFPQPEVKQDNEIEVFLPSSFLPSQLGDVFVLEQSFPSDYLHGAAPILSSLPLALISQWANDPRIGNLPLSAFAFLDTETSGLSGGTGTYAFLVGVGRFIHGQFVLKQFFMRDPAEEPALLEGLANFLAPAKALVTFNGKAFDAPLLTTRYT